MKGAARTHIMLYVQYCDAIFHGNQRIRRGNCKAVALRVLWIPEWRAQRTFQQNRKVQSVGHRDCARAQRVDSEMHLHGGVRDGVAAISIQGGSLL